MATSRGGTPNAQTSGEGWLFGGRASESCHRAEGCLVGIPHTRNVAQQCEEEGWHRGGTKTLA